MHFSGVLAVSACFALGYAADQLAFTSWPKDVAAGKPLTLTWAGAEPNQVSTTLYKHVHSMKILTGSSPSL